MEKVNFAVYNRFPIHLPIVKQTLASVVLTDDLVQDYQRIADDFLIANLVEI